MSAIDNRGIIDTGKNFDALVELIQQTKKKKERLLIILSQEDVVKKRILTFGALTQERLGEILRIGVNSIYDNFGETFEHRKQYTTRVKNLNEFDRDQALKMSTQRMPNGEPIPYKTGNLKRK